MIFEQKKIKKNTSSDKKKLLKDYLIRNLTYWSNIQKIYRTKIFYVLQPFPAWCKKDLCSEEIEIFQDACMGDTKKLQRNSEIPAREARRILNPLMGECW